MQLIAICTIYRNPTGAKVATGEFDDDGNPKLRADLQIVAPGETFDADPVEAQNLIELEAALPVEQFQREEADRIAAAEKGDFNGQYLR